MRNRRLFTRIIGSILCVMVLISCICAPFVVASEQEREESTDNTYESTVIASSLSESVNENGESDSSVNSASSEQSSESSSWGDELPASSESAEGEAPTENVSPTGEETSSTEGTLPQNEEPPGDEAAAGTDTAGGSYDTTTGTVSTILAAYEALCTDMPGMSFDEILTSIKELQEQIESTPAEDMTDEVSDIAAKLPIILSDAALSEYTNRIQVVQKNESEGMYDKAVNPVYDRNEVEKEFNTIRALKEYMTKDTKDSEAVANGEQILVRIESIMDEQELNVSGEPETPNVPDTPDASDTPDVPDIPEEPDVPVEESESVKAVLLAYAELSANKAVMSFDELRLAIINIQELIGVVLPEEMTDDVTNISNELPAVLSDAALNEYVTRIQVVQEDRMAGVYDKTINPDLNRESVQIAFDAIRALKDYMLEDMKNSEEVMSGEQILTNIEKSIDSQELPPLSGDTQMLMNGISALCDDIGTGEYQNHIYHTLRMIAVLETIYSFIPDTDKGDAEVIQAKDELNRITQCVVIFDTLSDFLSMSYEFTAQQASSMTCGELLNLPDSLIPADEVVSMIDSLPSDEELAAVLDSYENAGTGELNGSYGIYIINLIEQVSDAYAAYNELTDTQKSAVFNANSLLDMVGLLGLNSINTMSIEDDGSATPSGGFAGYVQDVSIESVIDGTANFDSNNDPGNDENGNNRIVRTFDSVKYDIVASFDSRDKASIAYESPVSFEASIDKGITEARFDVSIMSWLNTGYAEWQIDYIAEDSDGNESVVLIENSSGLYFANEDGTLGETTSINALVNGSSGDEPYQMKENPIVRQRIHGTVLIQNAENVFSGTYTFIVGIYVENADNGSKISPSFKAYFKNNPENYGEITEGSNGVKTSERVLANKITLDENYQGGAYVVTVSCAPLYNMMLNHMDEYINYLSWFDFQSGDEVKDKAVLNYLRNAGKLKENFGKVDPSEYEYAGYISTGDNYEYVSYVDLYNAMTQEQKNNLGNIRYGLMNGLGLTINLASSDKEGKKYKGCSLPTGTITFDLDLGVTTRVIEGTDVNTSGYSAILWDYKPNVSSTGTITYEDGHIRQWDSAQKGILQRNLRWENIEASIYAIRGAPRAYKLPNRDSCVYDSGYWNLVAIDNDNSKRSSSATDADRAYTFEVNDYDFDLSDYIFPVVFDGQSSNERLGITDFAFFGAYAEVLYVMPYVPNGTVEISRKIQLGNMELTDASGQKLEIPDGAARGQIVSANNEVDSSDNYVTGTVTQYEPGQFTKRSGFNKANAVVHTDGFLGTNFWNGPAWDESTYAGTDISIVGSVQITAKSSNHIRATNLLQIFDSEALSITPKSSAAGQYITTDDIDFNVAYENTYEGHNSTETHLFAADPDYPDGYDTNADGVVSYMNLVREEDLQYSDRLYWNESEKCYNIVKIGGKEYTCVGVLTEVRNCNYKDYCYVRIPVTVTDDAAFVGKTVCTINEAIGWVNEGAMDGITWLNGKWDAATGKNVLDGYETIYSSYTVNGGYGTAGNGYTQLNGANFFIKAEYDGNGNYSIGSGGKRDGASLLILGYDASVSIINKKSKETGLSTYALDNNELSVTWIVRGIKTEINTVQGTKSEGLTDLTIPVKLKYDGALPVNRQNNLFPIVDDSFIVTVPLYETDSQGNLILNANGKATPTGESQTYEVSKDPYNPTTITFVGAHMNEKGIEEDVFCSYKIYSVPNVNGENVTFYLMDVPIGQTLPEIQFETSLSLMLLNNDNIQATATISGSGDKRAYSITAGNMSEDKIAISKGAGSFLSKSVAQLYGELNTDINYTITYTNTSTVPVGLSYLFDILPYNSDTRSSDYQGARTLNDINFYTRNSSDGTLLDFESTITVYYSQKDSAYLNDLLYGFNGTTSTTDSPNQSAIEEMLQSDDFKELGVFDKGSWVGSKPTIPEGVNAVFARIENMGASRDMVMTLDLSTQGNEAGNIYGNNAWHWNADSNATPLQSNIVYTRILARTISGMVWYDMNWNGKQDDGEPSVADVVCTLYKLNEGTGLYEVCTQDVIGNPIGTYTTMDDGQYHFDKLGAGKYIVAFSGFSKDGLKDFVGATVYHAEDAEDEVNNDGVALIHTEDSMWDKDGVRINGIDENLYSYAIAFDLTNNQLSMPLHSIEEIIDGNLTVINSLEMYNNKDLGLVTPGTDELPNAGSTGNTIYIVLGSLFLISAVTVLFVHIGLSKKRRTHREPKL